MAANSLQSFHTEAIRSTPFYRKETNTIIYVTDYNPEHEDKNGIYEHDRIKNVHKLRNMPNLKYLSYDWEDRNRTVEQFWADYSARPTGRIPRHDGCDS